MDIIGIIEVFALVTGVPYIVLEVLQKNGMWYFGIATGLACAYSFAIQHVWSNMSLNIYYVVMSVWGLYQWRKDSRLLEDDGGGQDPAVHLGRMDGRTALWSAVTFIAGTPLLVWLLHALGGSSTWLDAASAMMSFMEGQYWLTLLYVAYVAAAAYGLFHWMRKGKYIN